jgi:TonB family protein
VLVALACLWLSSAEPAPDELRPPVRRNSVEIVYPAEAAARATPPSGTVVVQYVIGTDGVPHSLVVTRSVDPLLDAAALAAVAQLRFDPATVGGTAVEIETSESIAFAPPARPRPEPEPRAPELLLDPPDGPTPGAPPKPTPQTAGLGGRVLEAGTRVAIAAASIYVVPTDDDAPLGEIRKRDWGEAATTDAVPDETRSREDGRWALDPRTGAGKGTHRVRIIAVAPGFERYETVVELSADTIVAVDLYLARSDDNPYRTVVRTGASSRQEVTPRAITRQEITNLPGTQGDALKSIQNFPGIARAPFGIGLLVIRGADPTDSAVVLGGHEIPQLFHFGGLTSVFNADVITGIDFLPGNFDARYGDATGGIIDVGTRSGRRDGVHGYVDADLFDAGGLLEGPLGKGAFIVAARRSYIDAILPAAIPDDAGIDLTVAPRYWDYQAIFDHPLAGGTITARVFGSDDRTRLVAADPNEVTTDQRDRFESTLLFHRVDLAFERHGGGWDFLVTPSYRYDRVAAGAGDIFRFDLGVHTFSGRAEIGRRLGKRARLDVGTQVVTGRFTIDAESIAIPDEGAGSQNSRFTIDSDDRYGQPALFATMQIDVTRWLTLIPGVRHTYYGVLFQRGTTDPRLRFVARLGKRDKLRGGVGLYSQLPDLPEWNPRFGNPELGPEHAVHTSLAWTHDFGAGWTAEIAGFYKHLQDLAAPSRILVRRDGTIAPEVFYTGGAGRIVGGEVFVRKALTKRLFGWLSYTLSRSERRFDPREGYVPFDLDQTHILTLIAVVRLPKRWQVGGRFRLVSGNPTTPRVGATYDASSGDYIPIDGATNSRRVAPFHQLDLRVDKHFVWPKVTLDTYVDVQNVYNRANPEFLQDSYDYTRTMPVSSLPILPSIGVRLSW